MYRHCMLTGIPHALLEVRQDLIGDDAGVAAMGRAPGADLRAMNADPALHEIQCASFAHRPLRMMESEMTALSKEQQTEFEAAAFRRLVAHLRERSDVQNIDLMNLAGFCRNCLSNWYREAAEAEGVPLSRTNRARSSTACPMKTGRTSTRTRPRLCKRLPSN